MLPQLIFTVQPDGTLRAVVISGPSRNLLHSRFPDSASLVAEIVTPATTMPIAASRGLTRNLALPIVLSSVALAGLAVVESLRRRWGEDASLAFWRRS